MSTNLIESIRHRLTGDSLRGCNLERVKAKLPTIPRARLLPLLRDDLAFEDEAMRRQEGSRATDLAEATARAASAADQGQTFAIEHPVIGDAQKRYAEWLLDHRGDYGLGDVYKSPSYVLEACRERSSAIASELKRRRALEGEEPELVELRRQITDSLRAEWPPRAKVKELKERGGAMLWEKEILAAVAELNKAEAATAALRKRLWSDFGARH